MLKLSLTVGIARGYAEHLNGLLGFELSFDCRDSGVLNMCLLIDNIQKAIATAQSRYYKLVLAIPGTLLDPEQASAISVQDPGEQAPHTPIQGQESMQVVQPADHRCPERQDGLSDGLPPSRADLFANVTGDRPQKESSIQETNGWIGMMAALGTTPVNLGLLLSQSLLEVEPRFRSLEFQDLFARIIRSAEGDLVAFDHAEILFQRDLQLDPLRMLLQHSRNKVLIVRWPGVFSGDKLTYGEPHHPEYRCYEQVDAVVCCMNQGGE
ncbi:hypothetical protein SSCH_420041 [Syntrophaceticus schinkii]|jgi:hypothetical protein|uniref:Uncharacterized protein n=1 Tax=Syntrophaceticus schinkii TaxID=499207 RepID=A0A0B7MM29_9FIRM|nr:hypothetical protein SSCH_420041 [Syntrophaceticus schinkii]